MMRSFAVGRGFSRNVLAAALMMATAPAPGSARLASPAAFNYAGDECAGSHGDYSDPAWWDSDGSCLVGLSSADMTTIQNTISQFQGCMMFCGDIQNWLTTASFQEWTGNYNSGYEWDGFNLGNTVALHWDHVGDLWLLAHEGAHGLGYFSETDANQAADDCYYHVY
jgi:hypothetical protein